MHTSTWADVFTTMGSRAPVSQRWDLTRLTPQPCFCSELNLMACPVLVNLSQNPLTVITFLLYSLTSLPWSDFRLWIWPVYLVQGYSDFSTSLPDSFSISLLSYWLIWQLSVLWINILQTWVLKLSLDLFNTDTSWVYQAILSQRENTRQTLGRERTLGQVSRTPESDLGLIPILHFCK